ncbi:MAG: MjaI family restriction endonuclease [Pseudomonadota bacterium]
MSSNKLFGLIGTPRSIGEWWKYYSKNFLSKEHLEELGGEFYVKIAEVQEFTKQDCIDYIYNLILNRTFDGFLREKSVVNDGLAKIFPNIIFEESDSELDHAGDIDYVAKVNNRAFGIQIKPVTAKANFGNYSPTERMEKSFAEFEEQYGGKVFIVYSLDGEIGNKEVIEQIRQEIERLKK